MNDSAAPLPAVDHQITGAGPVAVPGHGRFPGRLFSGRAAGKRQGLPDWPPLVSTGCRPLRHAA